MTVLPRPTKETYIDFLRGKLKGRNISPEFMARNPAYFDLQGEDSPTTPATWETFYRRAKPKTSVDSGRDEGMFYPDPPVTNDLSKAYRDYYLAQLQNAPSDLARGIKRGWNEFTTGFPDLRSQDSIAKQQGYNLDEGLMQLPADLVPGYHNTGMSLQQELMPFTGLLSDPGIHGFTSEARSVGPRDIGDPIYESEINRYTPEDIAWGLGFSGQYGKFDPNVDVRGEAGIPALSNQAFGVSKWSPYESRAAAETRKADEEKYGEPGLFPNLEGLIGDFIRDEIWSPVERGIGELKDFTNDPGKYVDDFIKNIDYKDAISTGVGIAVNKLAPISGGLGLFGIPGALASVVVQGMMSEGGGQIGMPGTVMEDYWQGEGTSPTVTQSTIHGYANVPGIGVVAVNALGQPLGGAAGTPQEGVYSRGWSPTDAGQIAFDEGKHGGYIDSPVKGQGGNLPDASKPNIGDGFYPDDDEGGHQAGDVGSPSDEEPGEFGPDW